MAEASLTLALALASALAWPADLTIPKTFVPGTPATAGDVNQNFSATATSVNSKQDRVTGVCPAGQAVLSINADGSVVCDTNLNNRVTTIETSLLTVTDSGRSARRRTSWRSRLRWADGRFVTLSCTTLPELSPIFWRSATRPI